ncbi:M48 family metallopeptidase [Micromonospora sp. WMMD735]|uniref:M48 family metallopeptidase n=1 Tax=Micromonospora sp. WMMD735 TaxID=3404130 RepID=UPI003B9354DC
MKTWLQAVLSVVLLVGFLVLAVALVVGVGAFGLGYGTDGDSSGTREFRPLVVGAALTVLFALVFTLGRVLTRRPAPLTGILLSPEQAPELWRIVRDLAARVGTREPDDLRLVAEANAAVTEEVRLLGLLPGRRTVILGLPLLPAYTVDQIRAVLAHETGHFSGRHTRSVRIALRARMMIVGTAQNTVDGVLRAVLSAYARLFVAVEQGISRQMEYEADRYAVAVAGRDAMVNALREIRLVGTGWDGYLADHVLPAYDRGHLPEDLFEGFAAYLAECREEIRERSVEVAPAEPAWWESHPPLRERIAALRFVPDVSVIPDRRPATVLVPDLVTAGRRLRESLFDRPGTRLLPWDRLTPTLAHRSAREQADPLYRAAARLTGRPDADLGLLLDLLAQDRCLDLARELAPDSAEEDALRFLTVAYEGALEAAAVDSAAASWRHSWSGPPELSTTAGEPLPLGELVDLSADPATVPAARERLAALGIRTTATPAAAPTT